MLTPPHNTHMLTRFHPLPVLTRIISTLLPLLESEKATDEEIAGIITLEPSLLFQVLRITPPGPAGIMQVTEHLNKAIGDLGKNGLLLLISGILFRQCGTHYKPNLHAEYFRFWRHALACALIARELAESMAGEQPDVAYTAALIHGIGNIPKMMAPEGAEQSVNAMGEFGEQLLKSGYPLPLALDAARFISHSPEDIKTGLPSLQLIYAARQMADVLMDGEVPDFDRVREFAGLPPDQLETMFASAASELERTSQLLGIAETPEFTDPTPGGDALTGHMAKAMVDSAVRKVLDAATSKEAVFGTLRLTLKVTFGIENWLLALPDTDGRILTVIHSCVQGQSSDMALRIPADDGASLMARAFAEKRVLDSGPAEIEAQMSLADRQVLGLLGETAMLCMPWDADNNDGGLLICGVPQDWHENKGIPSSGLRPVLDAVLYQYRAVGAPETPDQKETSPEAQVNRLVVKKAVHEINNPLGIIKNYLSVLKIKLPEQHAAQSELRIIGDEIDRISGMLGQLVLSAPGSDQEWLDVNLLLEDMVNVVKSSLSAPDMIRFHTDLEETLPQALSDKDTIKQIVINLMKNAVEALDDGGNIYITTSTGNHAGFPSVCVGIRDDGPGIPEEVKSQLFQPINSSKPGGNSGLGLFITWQALKRIGGTISCESYEGNGTDFVFELPVQPDGLTPPEQPPAMNSQDASNT